MEGILNNLAAQIQSDVCDPICPGSLSGGEFVLIRLPAGLSDANP